MTGLEPSETYRDVTVEEVTDTGDLHLSGRYDSPTVDDVRFAGSMRLMLVRTVAFSGHDAAVDVWDAADGMGDLSPEEYDPSALRDSSPGARARMYAAATEALSRAEFCDLLGIDDPAPNADTAYLADAPEPQSPGQPVRLDLSAVEPAGRADG